MKRAEDLNQVPPEQLDINTFRNSPDLIKPFLEWQVFASLSTVRFADLAGYYRLRDAKQLPEGAEKPIYGQMLEFSNLDHFIAGVPTSAYPSKFIVNTEFSGIARQGENVVACNSNHLDIFANGQVKSFTHPLFNDLKFVDFSPDGKEMLVSSSGTDCLLEFSFPEKKLLWTWFAPEHGYVDAPDGTKVVTKKIANQATGDKVRVLDDGTDFSKLDVLTSSQAAHMNSARYADSEGNLIAATVYQRGHAILIDRNHDTTTLVKADLGRPHGFFRFGNEGNFVITSSTSGFINILDKDFRTSHLVNGEIKRPGYDRTWLQNTLPVGGDVLALIDHYNCQVIFFNIFTKERYVVATHPQWKIFQLAVEDTSKHTNRIRLT